MSDRSPESTSAFSTLHETTSLPSGSIAPPSPPDLLRDVQQLALDSIKELREHRNALRTLGMNLPANTYDAIKEVNQKLEILLAESIAEQTELHQLRALADSTALFHSAPNVGHVLQRVMDTAIQLTGAERGFVLLHDAERGAFDFRIARGIDQSELERDEFTVSLTIVNEVARTGQPVITDNARSDPRYNAQASIIGYQLRSILAVPLLVQETLIGVLYCDNRARVALFKPYDLALLEAFADQAAVAIQNARLFEKTREQLTAITAMRDLMDNIFVSVASGLIAVDASGIITVFNRAAEQITGITQASALGASVQTAMPRFTVEFQAELEGALFSGIQSSAERIVTMETGEPRVWNTSISPLGDYLDRHVPQDEAWAHRQNEQNGAEGGNDILGVTIVLDDLTEQRAREAQIAEVRRYLPSALVDQLSSDALASLGGVEREISVVFADVRGFTSFSEQLEPEDLMQIINHYLSAASDGIDRYQGIVDKYIGDAVTALFNTQLNQQPDHATRAVRAALQIRANITQLHQILPEEQRLFFGIGVHTGAAILGNVGSRDRREFAAMGDALEMSKLLQENAGQGEIMLSEQVYQQVKSWVECEPLTPNKTKGRADFTTMYRVLGER